MNVNRTRALNAVLAIVLLAAVPSPAFADYPDHFGEYVFHRMAVALVLSAALATTRRWVAGTLLVLWTIPGFIGFIFALVCLRAEKIGSPTFLASLIFVGCSMLYAWATYWRFNRTDAARQKPPD